MHISFRIKRLRLLAVITTFRLYHVLVLRWPLLIHLIGTILFMYPLKNHLLDTYLTFHYPFLIFFSSHYTHAYTPLRLPATFQFFISHCLFATSSSSHHNGLLFPKQSGCHTSKPEIGILSPSPSLLHTFPTTNDINLFLTKLPNDKPVNKSNASPFKSHSDPFLIHSPFSRLPNSLI